MYTPARKVPRNPYPQRLRICETLLAQNPIPVLSRLLVWINFTIQSHFTVRVSEVPIEYPQMSVCLLCELSHATGMTVQICHFAYRLIVNYCSFHHSIPTKSRLPQAIRRCPSFDQAILRCHPSMTQTFLGEKYKLLKDRHRRIA